MLYHLYYYHSASFFCILLPYLFLLFFFFNDTATTEIYTLSLHDALPISTSQITAIRKLPTPALSPFTGTPRSDRKSTRLNSSHTVISYAVFCLKKKKKKNKKINKLKTKK